MGNMETSLQDMLLLNTQKLQQEKFTQYIIHMEFNIYTECLTLARVYEDIMLIDQTCTLPAVLLVDFFSEFTVKQLGDNQRAYTTQSIDTSNVTMMVTQSTATMNTYNTESDQQTIQNPLFLLIRCNDSQMCDSES
ncbi:hypothetical protein J0S82_007547 [Galemys pyrenaicus]|uniref:Uncharacterized protein n=1 Tax=Galemys pyrenaicus TaxID=202257 RepID=A0A8J5ZPB7_GALPY|nr:hypothetical protein J0S82_007547 [Galemys pyrenaicus]